MSEIKVDVAESDAGWQAEVRVRDRTTTTHTVRISHDEHERYGGGDVTDLVVRSFAFLLQREPNSAILREFDLGTIERYFPEYAETITARS